MDSNAPDVHPLHALAVYAESIASGSRVALFGDASLGVAEKLVELGARSVHVWDPDADRAEEQAGQAPRGVTVRPYDEHETDLRPIDLVLVADLGLFEDPGSIVRRARRMVGEEGVALVAARSVEGAVGGTRSFDYYDLFDLVAPEFESVRMVGQLPFQGVALVELGEDEESPAVSVDTQLAESGRTPEAFVVVASQHGARLDPYSIVQLPALAERPADLTSELTSEEEAAASGEEVPSAVRPAEDDVVLDALAQAQIRAELLANQLEDMRARAADADRAAEAVVALEEALRARSSHAADLERSLGARGRELAELSGEVEEMRATAEAGRVAAAQVEEMAKRADRAERRLTTLEQELSKGGESQSKELAELEHLLRERSQALRTVEVELGRRDQMVRDLVGALDEAGPAPSGATTAPSLDSQVLAQAQLAQERAQEALRREESRSAALAEENARLRGQLDALAMDLARREGDSQATAWQVAELERQLAQAQAATNGSGNGAHGERGERTEASSPRPDPRLVQALDELDSLRAALSQEHEARTRAESGEELARARAEIERQAVLMEQLVRQLDARRPPDFEGPGSSEDSR
jgi:hypothetical protein